MKIVPVLLALGFAACMTAIALASNEARTLRYKPAPPIAFIEGSYGTPCAILPTQPEFQE